MDFLFNSTPFHLAVWNCSLSILEYLVSQDVEIKEINKNIKIIIIFE